MPVDLIAEKHGKNRRQDSAAGVLYNIQHQDPHNLLVPYHP
jgi:hypothetical protein